MTNVTMSARLRSMLDEATAVFYVDATELYPALSLAQLELTTVLANTWKQRLKVDTFAKMPLALDDLLSFENGQITTAQTSIAFTLDPIIVVSCKWQFDGAVTLGTPYAVELNGSGTTERMIRHPLLADGTYFWWDTTLLYVNPPSTSATASYIVHFVKTPVDITASVQPTVGVVAHDAIVERAAWILLKDRESEQAMTHLQMYDKLLQGLMI